MQQRCLAAALLLLSCCFAAVLLLFCCCCPLYNNNPTAPVTHSFAFAACSSSAMSPSVIGCLDRLITPQKGPSCRMRTAHARRVSRSLSTAAAAAPPAAAAAAVAAGAQPLQLLLPQQQLHVVVAKAAPSSSAAALEIDKLKSIQSEAKNVSRPSLQNSNTCPARTPAVYVHIFLNQESSAVYTPRTNKYIYFNMSLIRLKLPSANSLPDASRR